MQKRGVIRNHHSLLALGQRLVDSLLVVGLLPAICIWQGVAFSRPYQVTAILAGCLTWIFFGLLDVYRPWRGGRIWLEIRLILCGWSLVAVSLAILGWAFKANGLMSRLVTGSWFVAVLVAVTLVHVGARGFLRALRRAGRNTRSVVIVGAGDLGRELAQRIGHAEWMGLELVGYFDDDPAKQGDGIDGIPVLGTTDEAGDFVRRNRIDQVFMALPMRAEERMRRIFDQLQDTTASVYLIPDLFIFELMGARHQEIAGLPVFALCETPLTGPFGVLKRLEDLVLASLVLLFTWPVMLAIAVAIKLTSPGPVIFKQRRYGLNGKEILVWKFRTMTVCEDGDDVPQARRNDRRITPLGAFLRKTSLDELPQFINVLMGEMSIVGPRPHAVAHNEQYRSLIQGYMWRHKVKPGITGWAQINGLRGETDTLEKMEKRVEYDLYYIKNWSIRFDMAIFFKTFVKGFVNDNAY